MKYCLPYNKYTYNNDLINKADEWFIDYNPEDKTLLQFLELHKDKRINLRFFDDFDITEPLNIGFVKDLQKQYSNIYIELKDYSPEVMKVIKENEIKNFFFYIFVNNIDAFYLLINNGVSDVYIVETLGFDLERLSKITKEKNIQIRVFPNVAQSQYEEIPDLKNFFIRPEDIQDYEKFVDVCEFLYEDEKCLNYFHIYSELKEWYGDLSEIITGIKIKLDSRYMLPKFGEMRSRCRKRCFYGDSCHICDLIAETAGTLEEAGIGIEKEKQNGTQ